MLSGLLPDSQISASSMRDIHGSMGAARLVASRSGWFPNPTQPIAGEEWLQVRHLVLLRVMLRPYTSCCCFPLKKESVAGDKGLERSFTLLECKCCSLEPLCISINIIL